MFSGSGSSFIGDAFGRVDIASEFFIGASADLCAVSFWQCNSAEIEDPLTLSSPHLARQPFACRPMSGYLRLLSLHSAAPESSGRL